MPNGPENDWIFSFFFIKKEELHILVGTVRVNLDAFTLVQWSEFSNINSCANVFMGVNLFHRSFLYF